jgi:hypothetical protein
MSDRASVNNASSMTGWAGGFQQRAGTLPASCSPLKHRRPSCQITLLTLSLDGVLPRASSPATLPPGVNCQIQIELYPPARVAHIREVKALVACVLHTREFRLEARYGGIGASDAILRAEIERLVIPLAININDGIELRIFRWRLNVSPSES